MRTLCRRTFPITVLLLPRCARQHKTSLPYLVEGDPSLASSPAQDFFKHLDILVFVEATIYAMDEENELYAKQGLLMPHAHAQGE